MKDELLIAGVALAGLYLLGKSKGTGEAIGKEVAAGVAGGAADVGKGAVEGAFSITALGQAGQLGTETGQAIQGLLPGLQAGLSNLEGNLKMFFGG